MQDAVDLYLHFGYLPRPDVAPLIDPKLSFSNLDYAEPKPQSGVEILRGAVQRATSGLEHVIVPISGGLDSRAILAIAVESGLKVETFTVGSPGTDDFDFGADIAKFLRVRHVAHDVRNFTFSISSLTELARKLDDWVSPIDTWFNTAPLDEYDPSLPVLTGLYGDFVAGQFSIGSRPAAHTLEQFIADSALLGRPLKSHLETSLRKELPNLESSALSEYEISRLIFMHTCTYRPNVFKLNREYLTPFVDQEWLAFMMAAGSSARKGKKLYHEVLRSGWPSAFGRPTKNFHGASLFSSPSRRKAISTMRRVGNGFRRYVPLSKKLLGSGRRHNYADFFTLVSKNESFQSMVSDALQSLSRRNLILPIEPGLALDAALEGRSVRFDEQPDGPGLPPAIHAAKLYTDLEINLRALDKTLLK